MTIATSTGTVTRAHALAYGLFGLGVVIATTALLGPLAFGVIHYRTSPTTMNQLIGGDAAALVVSAPLCFVAGVLALRGWAGAAVVALAPSLFAVYTYAQLIVGEEYLRLPGNNERYFPLLLAGFCLGGAVAVAAWSSLDPAGLPELGRTQRRLVAGVLLGAAAFLLLQHLPSLADAVRDHPARTEYVSSPTPFWLVKLMDLGIVAPVAAVTGVGVARGRAWARRPMYALVGAYTLLGAAVTGMGVTMLLRDDPDATVAVAIGFAVFTVAFGVLALSLYRRLPRPASRRPTTVDPAPPEPPHGRFGTTLVTLETTLAVAATAGGVSLMARPTAVMPLDLLAGTPFSTWFWPGVALIAVVALPAAVVAAGALAHLVYVHIGHMLVGVVLMGWISVQLVMIGSATWLQPVCFIWGAVIALLGFAHYRDWSTRGGLRH
jgi:hypothetical protein